MNLEQIKQVYRLSNISLVLLFFCVLMIGFAGCFVRYDIMPDFQEQRSLTSLSSLNNVNNINDIPVSIAQFYSDNFGFRKPLLSAYFNFRLKVLQADFNLPTVLGNDGWLFLDGEIPFYRHSSKLTSNQVDKIRERLDVWCEYAHKQGAEFVFFISPNKSTIYPDKLPFYLEKFSQTSIFDQIYALDFKCNFIRIDLRNTFLSHQDELLYYKWGTHWNDRAAQLVWAQIKEQVLRRDKQFKWRSTKYKSSFRSARPLEDSMWQWFGQNDPYQIMLPSFEITHVKDSGLNQNYSLKPDKVVAFGDSFLQFMFYTAGFLAADYSTWVLHPGDKFEYKDSDIGKDAWLIASIGHYQNINIIDSFKPKLVMLEVVERNVLTLVDLKLPELSSKGDNNLLNEVFLPNILLKDVLGEWKAGEGVGRLDNIQGFGLLVTTETGIKAAGKIKGNQLEVEAWHVTGKVTNDRKKIIWSNGFFWSK